jgi:hypothetical protein
MPRVKRHKRSGKRHNVRSHYRTPPWVKTVLVIAGFLLVAAMANKAGVLK